MKKKKEKIEDPVEEELYELTKGVQENKNVGESGISTETRRSRIL